MRPSLALILAAALSAPALASPYDWHTYPHGDRVLAVEPSDAWLLLDAPAQTLRDVDVPALEATLAKALPGAVLGAVKVLDAGRVALEVPGTHAAALRRLGEALVAAGQAHRFWPGFARGASRGFFDDRVTVALAGAPDAAARKALSHAGLRLDHATPLPHVWVATATDGDAIGAAFAAQALPGVRWAEPDLIREVVAHQVIPNDPRQPDQWHLESPVDRGDIDAEAAWAVTTGDPDVVVAVFEVGGFDLDHPDLRTNIAGGFDWADGDEDPSAECREGNVFEARADPTCPDDKPYREAHGTAVAGLVAARANGEHGVGVCPDCTLMLVRMSARDSLRSINAAGAFRRAADEGAKVINNSWGPASNATFPLSVAEKEAFDYLSLEANDGKGVVMLFSAGNVFEPATNNPYNAYAHSMTISASTAKDDFACYSSYGAVIDVAAPSMGCYGGEPGVATTDLRGPAGYTDQAFTEEFSGTSAAAPVAAGVAALVVAANPDLTAQQVRLVLQASAEQIIANKNDWQSLIGRRLSADFAYDSHGHSLGFGYGKVNAGQAVALAQSLRHLVGAPCGGACPRCVADRCAPDCADDTACPGASRCLPAPDGAMACQIPTQQPDDLGAPCTDACEVCVATYDTEPRVVQICSQFCEEDSECPYGFDCRLVDPHQPKACVRGHQTCGGQWGSVRCDSKTRVANAAGDRFCSCRCVQGSPGACPTGFKCADVICRPGFETQSCQDAGRDFPNEAPHCVPDETWRAACEADADCAGGDHCLGGACQPDALAGACSACARCTTDAECGAGNTCEVMPDGAWRCTRACDSDADCAGDAVCREVVGLGTTCVDPGAEAIRACDTDDWRCSVAGRCQADGDCADGPCEGGFCPGAAPTPTPDMGSGGDTDGGVSVIPPSGDGGGSGGGCRSTGGESPTSFLWLLLLAALPRRRRR